MSEAGVSPAGIQQALDEVQNGKSPRQLIHEAGSGISSGAGGLGSGFGSRAEALPQGKYWGDAPTWSKADAEALKTLGRRLSFAGIGLDSVLTAGDIIDGAPFGEEIAKLGARSLGGWAGGFLAGATWGSSVGPEGTVIVGLLGAVAGAFGVEKVVTGVLGG